MNTSEDPDNTKVRYPVRETNITGIGTWLDNHPHTSFTDGKLTIEESVSEALNNGVYEKGAIEHGNPLDEDIDHLTTFMQNSEFGNESYTSMEIYPFKFENLRAVAEDTDGATTLTDADNEKVREDLDTLRRVYGETDKLERIEDPCLNYSIIIPHGIELDYNIPIEDTYTEDEKIETVESYEKAIIEFLEEAERQGSGFNYVLLSSHYVNTPFRPRYVKKDGLFEEMTHEEKMDVLEAYGEKETEKIESLSSKLGDMSVPEVSGELMTHEEINELEEFIYDQNSSIENLIDKQVEGSEIIEASNNGMDIKNNIVAVGAHPTLIERNTELMDAFRREEGLGTMEEIREELEEFYYDISHLADEIPENSDITQFGGLDKRDLDEFFDEAQREKIYPSETLRSFYRPMIDASQSEDNFIFEINGKGIERQHPSVFWKMLDEYTFGSDSHRLGEQPSRSKEFSERDFPGELTFLSEKWLERLKDDEGLKNKETEGKIQKLPA